MRRKLILLFLLLPALGLAQSKVHLEFQSSAPRIAWVSDQLTAPSDSAIKFDSVGVDLDVSSASPDSYVEVLDTSSGNLAAKRLSTMKKGWLVSDKDFNLVGHTQVKVQHEGAPVQFAFVEANDGARTQKQFIDSEAQAKGIADFYALKPGNLKISVNYDSDQKNKTQNQAFQLDLKRDSSLPLFVVEITSPVQTINPKTAGPAGSGSASATGQPIYQNNNPPPANSTIRSVFLYILGLCFAGAIIYFGFIWLQKNHSKADAALKKFGVILQDPQHHDPSLGVPVTPAAIQPQQQILLGDAAPTPIGTSSAQSAPVAQAVAPASPQLRGETGLIFPLHEGVATVGRDDGLDISLGGESSVSRKHAEIVKHGSHVTLRDLGSTNGSFVNGQKVNGEVALSNGDSVQFGAVRFRYEG